VTLARQPTTVKPLGGKGAGQAGCIAAPQVPINAILDVLASLSVDHIDMSATPISCGARSPVRG
jgi:aerobic carbon-monoxide dehydrogenase large subunit